MERERAASERRWAILWRVFGLASGAKAPSAKPPLPSPTERPVRPEGNPIRVSRIELGNAGRDDVTPAGLRTELAAIRAAQERQAEAIELIARHVARLDRSTITLEQLAGVPAACMPPGSWREWQK
jgi:hypothetical protein